MGHNEAEFVSINSCDQHLLVERIGDVLTADHLWKVEVVAIITDCHAGAKKVEKLLYFMKDKSVKELSDQELLHKSTK